MAVQIREAFKAMVPNAKDHPDPNVQSAFQIARLIRNAFTYQPFHPTWSIDPDCCNRTFAVRDIIMLNTTTLQGKRFDWRDDSGPLTLLRLSEFVRVEILGDSSSQRPERIIPKPEVEYYQQGDLLLKKVDKIPEGARRLI